MPHFPRFDPPLDSRSPSRSPRRKGHFAVKELDPLLANLSPDSTLKALQATETIPGGSAQDALTSSIGDATPAEREIGIRAAFAAQKLREWQIELSQWTWPGKRERALGLGFIPPREARETNSEYRGFLPVSLAEQYDARLEEIRDDLDSLGMEDIKDHVLEAHVPSASSPLSFRSTAIRTSYGRMRDFTALVTATVIQALPDLAKLNALLDTWDIRLRVLRSLSPFLATMQSTEREIEAAFQAIRNAESAQNVRAESFENRKLALGGRVSDLGRWVDRLLDMLEGHEDSLPQGWIDQLEKIELDYATWVVEAQHLVHQNELSSRMVKDSVAEEMPVNLVTDESIQEEVASGKATAPEPEGLQSLSGTAFQPTNPRSGVANKEESQPKRKPSLKLDMSGRRGHKREMSKVSVADSTYSTFSDISNAEIMDAKTTSVLPSPKVSVVDNPFRTSRDELTWFGNPSAAQQHMASRPPVLQRASTALIEVVPKEQLKEVLLRRSVSWDMLSRVPSSPESTPTKALKQLTGSDSPKKTAPVAELEASVPGQCSPVRSTGTTPLSSPSLQVEPLHIQNKDQHADPVLLPSLPRRSSKRNVVGGYNPSSPHKLVASIAMDVKENNQDDQTRNFSTTPPESASIRPPRPKESLDDKIQDILTTLPTQIRLTKDGGSSGSTQQSSRSSTRSSTPIPSLTLSPAKAESSSRKSSSTEPEIRVYHLSRTGQARDAPPVKLFVRAVGDGHRVMVRVGGGWADLAEYLKEYSLHHGSRATVDGRLEVASFPGSRPKDSPIAANGNGTSGPQGRPKTTSPSATQTTFGLTSSPELVNPRRRSSPSRPRSPETVRKSPRGDGTWTPPPVPPIPSSYTATSPTIATATRSDMDAITSSVDRDRVQSTAHSRHSSGAAGGLSNMRSISINSPGVTTTTVVTPPVTSSYTPLGAAGPKMNGRRAATFGTTSTVSNDAWVEGLVGKARAVSGGNSTVVQAPTMTTTTTTTTIRSTTPITGRTSYFESSPSPRSSPMTGSSSPSTGSVASDAKSRRSSLSIRSKSRMSLSDMSGIKRVFLRKKSEQIR